MCGRYSLATDAEELQDYVPFDISDLPYGPRYNIAPTQSVLAIIGGDKRSGEYMRWGLIPSWKKSDQKLPLAINARAETADTNGMFQTPLKRRRCLIPADGYYEWTNRAANKKVPMRIGFSGWKPFAFGGIWDEWESNDGVIVRSCAIITTPANKFLSPIHDRMPLILPREFQDFWIAGDTGSEQIKRMMKPHHSASMLAYQVSDLVNSSANEFKEVTIALET